MTSMPARSFRTVNAKGNVNTSIFGISDHFEQPLQAKVLRSVQNGLAMYIWGIAINQVARLRHGKCILVCYRSELTTTNPLAPFVDPVREGFGRDRLVRAARRRHVSIRLTKPDDAPITRSTKKQKVCAIRCCVVRRSYRVVDVGLVPGSHLFPSFTIPAFECLWSRLERSPYLHEWFEHVRTNSPRGHQRGQYCSAAQKRLVVCPEFQWEIRHNLSGKTLLITHPLQELTFKR